MTVYVFTGPTLAPADAAAVLDAVYLPPAAQGDVYRAALSAPAAIGIIDGYFAHAPAIAHKEILWAMSQGIRVYGAASMGALRAAELAPFGMSGVGAIYERVQSGELEDDDEVAVAHATRELGYRAQSEAMVNVRATLRAALEAGVLGAPTHDALVSAAKRMFYADRCYPALLEIARGMRLPDEELERLRVWLPAGRVDAKRADALQMLRAIGADLTSAREPLRVRYTFQHSEAWETVRRRAVASVPDSMGATPESLREELIVSGLWATERRELIRRALALELARRAGFHGSASTVADAARVLQREHRLPDADALDRWMVEHGIDDVDRFLRSEAQVRWAERAAEALAAPLVEDHLRRRGGFAALRERASDKRRRLEARGLEAPTLAELGIAEAELWRWYFEERLSREVPADLSAHARAQGLPDEHALRRIVLRELAYSRCSVALGSSARAEHEAEHSGAERSR